MLPSIYFCPYCQLSYQINSPNKSIPKCTLCGDTLFKKDYLSASRIIAVILASVFISPLIIFLLSLLQDRSHTYRDKHMSAISIHLASIDVHLLSQRTNQHLLS